MGPFQSGSTIKEKVERDLEPKSYMGRAHDLGLGRESYGKKK